MSLTTMHISQAGLDLIKSFEGYLDRLPDGSCRAYLCPAKVWTIGWGCTEGVSEGLTWTKDQAEKGLRTELIKHENHVKRLVTTDINQNEFDALTSFCYNVGAGALAKSTVLRCLNKGDRAGAARGFALWNKGGGKVLPGLVIRRQREATLFLSPVAAPTVPEMPQKVEQSPGPVVSALKGRTVLSQLTALFGVAVLWAGSMAEQAVQVGLAAVEQLTKMDGLTKLTPTTKYMTGALTVLAVILAIYARIDDAKGGKR
jgi:lysozyme